MPYAACFSAFDKVTVEVRRKPLLTAVVHAKVCHNDLFIYSPLNPIYSANERDVS